jgi:hypothetical protein
MKVLRRSEGEGRAGRTPVVVCWRLESCHGDFAAASDAVTIDSDHLQQVRDPASESVHYATKLTAWLDPPCRLAVGVVANAIAAVVLWVAGVAPVTGRWSL